MAKVRYTTEAYICPREDRVRGVARAAHNLLTNPKIPEHVDLHVTVAASQIPNHILVYAYTDIEE